jgi:hypothetical protein
MTLRFAVLGLELLTLTLDTDNSPDQEIAPAQVKTEPTKLDKIRKTAAMMLIR